MQPHRQLFTDWLHWTLAVTGLASSSTSSSSTMCSAATAMVAVAAAAAAYAAYCSWRRARDLPPGPVGVPLLGRLPWADALCLHLTMQKECQKYGDLCSFYLGGRLFVVVNSYPLMKEMLDDPVFAGRPRLRLFEKMTRNCGIFLVEGKVWCHQRRLSLRTLREIGFSGSKAVGMIEDQLEPLLQQLDEAAEAAQPVKTLDTFLLAVNSVITEMTLGRRFHRDDPDFKKVTSLIAATLESGISETACFLFPAAEKLLDIIPMSTRVFRDVEYLNEFFRQQIRLREAAMPAGSDVQPTCLCDAYIQEKRKAEKAGDFETFKEFQLIRVCFEFYLAGTDTTARSMEWLLLYMAFYPEVQDRVQNELDSVVGQSRRPRMQDRTELHYTSAVIDETYRKASLAAIGVFHRSVEDATFHGYRIPSDAIIIPLVYGVHHRAEYWERPNEFYPEHFLDNKGRYRSSPYLIPFLIGRRSCVGESLARMEIFLFFTAIMQRYRVRPEPESAAKKDDILRGHMGSLRVPGDYRLIFSRR
ncbi:hypothetical protein BOX15_Mlig001422g2 [Macrostomum lignano]|uniref:Cytochrome P450 n=2 Tax=Macrostomum lignano TaxID=282301 RepID=A0A267E0A3_9PLAT|nr:hypothetical protein BOX15_Mlig001422g4 [Macrostomum lignano]PAA54354.1 hypothetical protein BOX15_Mlig001422g2 [Macrostomum lignano]